MIKTKMQYRRPKLTIDEKVTRKCVTEVAKNVAKNMKSDIKTFKLTGALSYSIGVKPLGRKLKSFALVGVKSRYQKQTRYGVKTPNKYAKMQNLRHGYLERNLNADVVEQLKEIIKNSLDQIIKVG